MGMMGVSTAAPMTSTMMAHPGALPAAGVAGMPVMAAPGAVMPGQVVATVGGGVVPGVPVAAVPGMVPVSSAAIMPGAVMQQPVRAQLYQTLIFYHIISINSFQGAELDWAVPPATQAKYSAAFQNTDKGRTGFLAGVQARNILLQSGLPQNILAQIW